MFSNLILRNSRRSRKENGLFFSSLVISIIAFYMILSISTQDVMIFLQKMESDAVNRLLLLIPVFYGMTLGILFFLIYFTCKGAHNTQLKERNMDRMPMWLPVRDIMYGRTGIIGRKIIIMPR